MATVPYSRHNDESALRFFSGMFLLGTVLFLGYLSFLHPSFSPGPEFSWDDFWKDKPHWSSLICMLSAVLWIPACRIMRGGGRWLIGLSFALQGVIFSFCVALICASHLDSGAYLALFSVAAPAFLLLFAQLFWVISNIQGYNRLAISCFAVFLCYLVRIWGFHAAEKIYFVLNG